MTKTLFRWLVALLMMFAVASCDALPTLPPPPPTSTPAPSPTPVVLGQTFSGRDLVGNTLSVNYPATWAQGGNADTLILATSARIAQDPTTADMSAGDVGVSISVVPASLASLAVAEGVTPSAYNILLNYITSAQQNNPTLGFSTPELTLFGAVPVAFSRSATASDESMTLIADVGTGFAIVNVVADAGALADALPTVRAIVASLTYASR